jgi:hypothetical protein
LVSEKICTRFVWPGATPTVAPRVRLNLTIVSTVNEVLAVIGVWATELTV